jgi:phospholipid/cholesterol/gamma-HCH transport system permease protein
MASQPPLSLYPQRPGKRPGLVTRVGAGTLASTSSLQRLFTTFFRAVASPLLPGRAGRLVSRRVTVRQIFFTGFEALPLVSVIAILVGATIILQAQLTGALPAEVLGTVLVAVVLREVAPLTTAIVVAGRSGTAIATELGNMKANQELLGLLSLGIDPSRFVVLPRLIGTVISVLVLTVYFGAMAIFGGWAASALLGGMAFEAVQAGFASALLPGDLPLFVLKGIGLGTIVGWLCCHFGMEVRSSPTEVPRRASQAVVYGMLACVIFNTLATIGFYWLVGPSVR